jgi:hypothetical protein
MGDWLSDLPGWLKGLIVLAALGGSNGLQFLGFTAPAKKEYAAVEDRCFVEMKELRQELVDCWKERAKECGR